MMISFNSDYLEGCTADILDALNKTNLEQTEGYGLDKHSERARELIKRKIGRSDVDIHFVSGGTQANLLTLSVLLSPYQSVISADSGHIAIHETGSIETTGHQVIRVKNDDGKLNAEDVLEIVRAAEEDYTARPGAVYISESTESGTIYSLDELKALRKVTNDNGIALFIDGARLAYALESTKADFTLRDIADLSDAFYIGGTKCGALFGEAIVICSDKYKKDFRKAMKARGAMLAKGRILGIQFETLFTDDLYFRLAREANRKADEIKNAFKAHGIRLYADSYTNQQFVVLSGAQAEKIKENFSFEVWGKEGDETIARFCTSWATGEDAVNALKDAIKTL